MLNGMGRNNMVGKGETRNKGSFDNSVHVATLLVY